MRVFYQPLSEEVLTCSHLNLRGQMLKMFTSRRDLRSGRGGLSFCYFSRLENLQPSALHNLWVLTFCPPPQTRRRCVVLSCRLHKDARCLVCLHLVTARSSFQQAHVLGAPVLLVFTLTPPLHWLVITRLHSLLTLPLRNNRRSPAPPAPPAPPVNVPAAVFLCLQ